MHFGFLQNREEASPAASFPDTVRTVLPGSLRAAGIDVLQVNLGYRCNMACRHCHISAGPSRPERMEPGTVDSVLRVLAENPIGTLDITGGAPELNERFSYLVAEAGKLKKHVIVRTNLTIFFEPGKEYLPEFLREQGVQIVASLPCYLEENVRNVRGAGSFEKSIRALQLLNRLGFGRYEPDSLRLNLVYNPAGPALPPLQAALEADYRRELKTRYDVTFTRLLAFTNMPIGRFRDLLAAEGRLNEYRAMLSSAFNPAALVKVMCRTMVNVGWDGALYDCDFNQMTGMKVTAEGSSHISDFDFDALARRAIAVDEHCYGCTAGQGST